MCYFYSLDGTWLLRCCLSGLKIRLLKIFIIRCKTCKQYGLMNETDNFHIFYDFHWAIMPKRKSNDTVKTVVSDKAKLTKKKWKTDKQSTCVVPSTNVKGTNDKQQQKKPRFNLTQAQQLLLFYRCIYPKGRYSGLAIYRHNPTGLHSALFCKI